MLPTIFERFVQQSPLSVMLRGLMERIFAPARLDELFGSHARIQYTRELLFSSLVDLMSLVVCNIYPSVHAAYRAQAQQLSVSASAVYDKLNGIELDVTTALLRETAAELAHLIEHLTGVSTSWLEGYHLRVLDGNCLSATDHRLDVLKPLSESAMPGKSLVVLDPILHLALNIFPCEDGHAQERALFHSVIDTVQPQEIWIADRNMCTCDFLLKIHDHQAHFVIRETKVLPWQAVSELEPQGTTESGALFEQSVRITNLFQDLTIRRIVLKLNQPTRKGEDEIVILTDLAPDLADSATVAQLYRCRWSVEHLFQIATVDFKCEIQSLGYPAAALFSFTMALVAANILATIKAILSSVHGEGKVEAGVSEYYLVEEFRGVYRGMMIAIPTCHWQLFISLPLLEFIECMQQLAAQVSLKRFMKQPRGVKKKKKMPPLNKQHPRVATARLLSNRKLTP